MKNRKQCLIVTLALILALTLSLGILMACNKTHECESKCSECGKCTNLDCDKDECKDKCEGHDTPTPPTPPTPTNPAYTKDMDIDANTNDFEPYEIPAPTDGKRQVIFYWRESGHNYADNDIWLWEIGGAAGQAFELHECEYGAVAVIDVASTTTSVGFIVRKDATTHTGSNWGSANKVYEADRTAILIGDVTVIYLTGANQYQFSSTDGGSTLTMIKAVSKMAIKSFTQIEYGVVPSTKLENISQITVKCDGQPVEIDSVSSLNKTTASGTIKLKNEIDLTKNYEVTIDGYDAKVALPLGIFDSEAFTSKYNYDGELGVILKDGSADFKLWAPTASNVVLNIFEAGNGGEAVSTITMNKPTADDKGVWSHHVEDMNDVINKYYTYTVTTSAGAQEAVDPYAKSAGVNGDRGMIINLADTDPAGFAESEVVTISSYTDAVIWETHVRDFSNTIEQSEYKGKYLAFTETGLTNSHGVPVGVDYVKDLGITHIHLLPVFDYASVDEASTEPQFNWGYDPKNYNVPEGSYSTDPYHGEKRVTEFKQMVTALHSQGLGVIMDVVYNHTYDKNSNLNKVVPNYYYRYNSDGSNSSGSGCGNDTASERYMFSRYMVDSVTYWVKEYKLDGLRFDLMGLHDIPTMKAIEEAVHAINPNAIIYGEGWTMTTAAKSGTVMATQTNIKQIKASAGAVGAVAVFNDAIRDGVRGSVFAAAAKGYVTNGANKENVAFGLLGGERKVTGSDASWTVSNAGVINYISAHDNHTLWDRLHTPYLPENIGANETVPEKDVFLARNRLGATIVMLSRGTPFMTAGEEMLRSKVNEDGTFNENSYNSGDEVNNLKWESLQDGSDELAMYNYYKGLIEMRTQLSYFHDINVSVTVDSSKDYLVVKYTYRGSLAAVAIINGASKDCEYTMPAGAWTLVCNGTQAGATEIASVESDGKTTTVTVPAGVAHVYVV